MLSCHAKVANGFPTSEFWAFPPPQCLGQQATVLFSLAVSPAPNPNKKFILIMRIDSPILRLFFLPKPSFPSALGQGQRWSLPTSLWHCRAESHLFGCRLFTVESARNRFLTSVWQFDSSSLPNKYANHHPWSGAKAVIWLQNISSTLRTYRAVAVWLNSEKLSFCYLSHLICSHSDHPGSCRSLNAVSCYQTQVDTRPLSWTCHFTPFSISFYTEFSFSEALMRCSWNQKVKHKGSEC